jgi:hypothetical protein
MTVFVDSRLQRWAVLVDEVRCGVADLQEEKQVPALQRVRTYANWMLTALADADMELAEGQTL